MGFNEKCPERAERPSLRWILIVRRWFNYTSNRPFPANYDSATISPWNYCIPPSPGSASPHLLHRRYYIVIGGFSDDFFFPSVFSSKAERRKGRRPRVGKKAKEWNTDRAPDGISSLVKLLSRRAPPGRRMIKINPPARSAGRFITGIRAIISHTLYELRADSCSLFGRGASLDFYFEIITAWFYSYIRRGSRIYYSRRFIRCF